MSLLHAFGGNYMVGALLPERAKNLDCPFIAKGPILTIKQSLGRGRMGSKPFFFGN